MPKDYKIRIDSRLNDFHYTYHPSGTPADPHHQSSADRVAWRMLGSPQGFTIDFGSQANCPFTWSSPSRHFDSLSWVANIVRPGASGQHKYTVRLDSGRHDDPFIFIDTLATKKFLVEKVVPFALIAGGAAMVALGISLLKEKSVGDIGSDVER